MYSSLDDGSFQLYPGYDGSMFLGPLQHLWVLYQKTKLDAQSQDSSPLGLSDSFEQFLLDQVVDGAIDVLKKVEEPAFVYLHFMPPHDPYAPTRQFYGKFEHQSPYVTKPAHPLAPAPKTVDGTQRKRELFDEYLASWDDQVSRLFDFLKSSGLLDRSYVMVTSDHGNLFERGVVGHSTPLLYDAITHVPLIVSVPGQHERKDIQTHTSAVDILPTLAKLAGSPIPAWAEGTPLPELGGVDDPERSVYSMDAQKNFTNRPLTKMSISLTKKSHRLMYFQYPEYTDFEFYDLVNDPEELHDLFPKKPALALQMKAELLQKIAEVNKPYES